MKIPNQRPRVWMILLKGKQAKCKVADQGASTFFHDKLEVKNRVLLVINKGYRVRATTIEGQNAFALSLCSAYVSCDSWSKHAWSDCVLCSPFILRGSPNECWLHTCHACAITTWRWGLRAPLVARNKCLPSLSSLNLKNHDCVRIARNWRMSKTVGKYQ